MGTEGSSSNLRYYPSICLERLRKTLGKKTTVKVVFRIRFKAHTSLIQERSTDA
jgi:hypothetical protein